MTSDSVVVTGLGFVNPLGIGAGPFWSALAELEIGAGGNGGGSHRVPDFDLFERLGCQEGAHTRHMDEYSRYAVLAASLALRDSRLTVDKDNAERVGAIFGSDYGCLTSNCRVIRDILQKGPRSVDPVVFQNTVSNTVNGYVSILLGLKGISSTVSGSMSGYVALCIAYDLLKQRKADAVLAGGVEELSEPIAAEASCRDGVLSELGCDRKEVGSDGSVILTLERRATARNRKARIYAEFTGYRTLPEKTPEQSFECHVRMELKSALAEIGVPLEGVGSAFLETEASLRAARELFSSEGQDVRCSGPNSLFGMALASSPMPAVCAQHLAHASMQFADELTPNGKLGRTADKREWALAVSVEADGAGVVLAFRRHACG